MPWGIIASVAGPIIGGILGGNAAENAADTQAAAANNASATQLAMFNTARNDSYPWRLGGGESVNRLRTLLGLNPNAASDPAFGNQLDWFDLQKFRTDPGYQFRLAEGEKAINRGAAAAGRYDSGRTLKDLARFNQGLADQSYGDAFNRYNTNKANTFNRLSTLAGMGQVSAGQSGNQAMYAGNSLANIALQSGAAQAAGQMGAANAWGSAIGSAYKNYNNNRATDWLTSQTLGRGGNSYDSYGNYSAPSYFAE